ncbi:MAG: hypothetical protein ACYTDV_17615 [Planctomycetota bacterium]|jgi:hypothetical protein
MKPSYTVSVPYAASFLHTVTKEFTQTVLVPFDFDTEAIVGFDNTTFVNQLVCHFSILL